MERLTALKSPVEKPMPGYLTSAQWAAKAGLSDAHARRLLLFGVKKGAIKRRCFRVPQGDRAQRVPHYAEVK